MNYIYSSYFFNLKKVLLNSFSRGKLLQIPIHVEKSQKFIYLGCQLAYCLNTLCINSHAHVIDTKLYQLYRDFGSRNPFSLHQIPCMRCVQRSFHFNRNDLNTNLKNMCFIEMTSRHFHLRDHSG